MAGNSALRRNWEAHRGRVLGFFCFDPKFLSRKDFSADRFAFFLETLRALREELRELGGDLLVFDHGPAQAFEKLWADCVRAGVAPPATVSFNRDYEPFARARDEKMSAWFTQGAVELITERDHLVIEPSELMKDPKSPAYAVYTPFAKKWFGLLAQPEFHGRIRAQAAGLKYLDARKKGEVEKLFTLTWKKLWSDHALPHDELDRYAEEAHRSARVKIPAAGSLAALEAVDRFRPRLKDYGVARDDPAEAGTSQLSIYFKNGSLTTAQVIARLKIADASFQSESSVTRYLKELVWREFYYHVLWHRPDVETQSYLAHYRDIEWENDKGHFNAWKEGRTGYPIVDAGMRQLNETGWMHNRVRMIVASFLVKDLLIDWRWGERYFMERLLDGDLAPNNGGWQWAASTGCDPQPYFRIFNPELQSKKFDAEGEYIRRWVPELSGLSKREIHAPSEGKVPGYPAPIVHHASRRLKALLLYTRSSR